MLNKRRATQVEVQQLTHNGMPQSLMTDLESSMLSALNQIGCLFHLSKNVVQRVQDIVLQQQTFLTDPLFRGNTRMITALSFVLAWDVILAFDELCNHCGIC